MKRERFFEIIKEKNLEFPIDWFSYNIPLIEKFLDKISNSKNMLEIGSWEGMSACYFLLNFHNLETLTVIDPFFSNSYEQFLTTNQVYLVKKKGCHLDQYKRFTENIKKCGFEDKTIVHKDFSQHILPILKKNTYDFIFIDGAHNVNQVAKEIDYCYNLLTNNGYILFDDYDCVEKLKNTIDEYCIKYNLKVIAKYRQLLVQKK